MLIGYAYTTTGEEDLKQQRAALTAIGCVQIFEDEALNNKYKTPQLNYMLDQLREGDVVVITELNRVALPSTRKDVVDIANHLKEHQAALRSLKEDWVDADSIVPEYLDRSAYKDDPVTLKPVYDYFVDIILTSDDSFNIKYPYYFEGDYKGISRTTRWRTYVGGILEIFLEAQSLFQFDYAYCRQFCEKLRRIGRWHEMRSTLEKWFQHTLREPFIGSIAASPYYGLKDDVQPNAISPAVFEFACYIAVCHLKYGLSFDYLAANEIFAVVTMLGSRLPEQLKKYGTGDLPRSLADFKDDEVAFNANDAFGTIKIAIKAESENNYRKILSQLARLLKAEFPPSYAIDFRCTNKVFLPLRGLPKRGVNQLFANAIKYPALRPLIEEYARVAMRKFELYSNMPEENPVMPGTFAVFALVLVDEAYVDLCLDYLDLCDGEHQSVHGNLIHAYIAIHGFTRNAIRLLVAAAGNIQHMGTSKAYPALVANESSLGFLVQSRQTVESGSRSENPLWAHNHDHAWRNVIASIWGEIALDRPDKIINAAPEDLRSLYRAILS